MATPPVPVRPGPWRFFGGDEAVPVEAAVDRLMPADERGPGGKDAGCAVFIDRQLAGPYGRCDGLYTKPPFMQGAATQGYQLPDSPAARYRAGLGALADYVMTAFAGRSFAQLHPTTRTRCSPVSSPDRSRSNRYCQSRDVHNVFVRGGASVFPQNHGYNPTDTVGALAYWTADAIKDGHLKNPGPLA